MISVAMRMRSLSTAFSRTMPPYERRWAAVTFFVEVGGPEELHRPRQALPIEEHPPEHCPLCLQAMRRDLGGEQVGEGRHDYSRVTETLNCAVTSAGSRT